MDEQLKTILDLVIDLTNIQIEHEREELGKIRKSGDINNALVMKKVSKKNKLSKSLNINTTKRSKHFKLAKEF